jgi:hypothetical protein
MTGLFIDRFSTSGDLCIVVAIGGECDEFLDEFVFLTGEIVTDAKAAWSEVAAAW